MSDSSPNLLLIAVIAGVVVVGGFLVLRDSSEPVSAPDDTENNPTSTPEGAPDIYGIVGINKYVHTTSDSTTGIKVSWTNTADAMYVGLESPGTGWVAIGFDPDTAMSGANFIFGYATSVRASARDEYGVGLFSHGSDTGNDDIIDFAATESDGTVFEFGIPLDSGDSTDKPLTPGSSYTCLIAYGNSDNFTTKHTKKGSISITLY